MTQIKRKTTDSDLGNPNDDLDQLVESTAGLQPWRRLFHMTSGVAVSVILLRGYVSEPWALVILGVVLALMLALDLVRLRHPETNRRFFLLFRRLASPREARGLASSTWYVTGMLLTLALFPLEIAAAAILVLAVADPFASYLGRRFGKRALGSGTVEGTLVFLAMAFLMLALLEELPVAAGVALLATVVEPIPWRLDDNLTVPIAVGVGLLIAGALV
jgi:dolichol kinase